MFESIIQHEISLRLGFFFVVLGIIGMWEVLAPKRQLSDSKIKRWGNNLGLTLLNTITIRLLFPTAAVGVAYLAQQHQWGILNYLQVPYAVAIVIAVITLDFIIYLQHVMVHVVPVLWRLHRVHHADLDYDVTTGARFHTLEILISMLIKFASIVLLGAPAVAVIVFEILLNATAMFNHGNIRLPQALDRWLRWIVVTPDMHRVHHSVEDDEANSNFGFNLPWWDRLMGTYRDQPRATHESMTLGIHQYRDPRQVDRLPGMLLLPFKGKLTDYAINRRRWNNTEDEKD